MRRPAPIRPRLKRPARGAAAAIAAVTLLLVGGCVHVPTVPAVPEPMTTDLASPLDVEGPNGALSQRDASAQLKLLAAQAPDAEALERHLAVEQRVAGTPLYIGNRVTVLRDGPTSFAAIFAAIHAAQHYLYLEYYIFGEVQSDGEQLSDLLIARARQGVRIDVLYDSVGSFGTPRELFDRLAQAGIYVKAFNPFIPLTPHFSVNKRDHRKLLLADGSLAIIGGVNLSAGYENSASERGSGPSNEKAKELNTIGGQKAVEGQKTAGQEPVNDTDLQIEGPAVRELQALFEEHWRQQDGERAALADMDGAPQPAAVGEQLVRVIGSQGGGRLSPRYYATLLSSIRSASSQIDVTTAYFGPTRQESEALLRAAQRGVKVRLLLPAHGYSTAALSIQHGHYGPLLHAGCEIYEQQDAILHSKIVVADGTWSIVGSSNFDHRSVLFNDEIDAVVIGSRTGAELESIFEDGVAHAQRVAAEAWNHRPLLERLRERFWLLWEALL
jgi:cardiolipin synthase